MGRQGSHCRPKNGALRPDKVIVAFVTNGSWVDSNSDAGGRACLAEDFSSIHLLNLWGNQRTQGERFRRQRRKVFRQGSRAPVAITILVRKKERPEGGCRTLYRAIGDYPEARRETGHSARSRLDAWHQGLEAEYA